MQNILLIGAGRSSSSLINYLLQKSQENSWFLTVADANPDLAKEKVNNHPNGRATWLDVTKTNDRRELIARNDVVISLLPVYLHSEVAQDCMSLKKHLVTASYVSKEIIQMSDQVKNSGLVFMGEMGLDPGLDHMSAIQKINEIKAKGGKLLAFRSYTGGLVAPESDDNPWHYKISWNPRNVVLAGQGTAQYLENGKHKYIPYNRLFTQFELVDIQGLGEFEMYANRDSLLYRESYGIADIPNIIRGTLRHKGYCEAWNALRKIGLTDASYPIVDSESMTFHELMEAYVSKSTQGSVRDRIAKLVGTTTDSVVMEKLDSLGLFSKKKIKMERASPAQILESILIEKWAMKPSDKDMVIMQHEFEYVLNGKKYLATSTMSMKGENSHITAMGKLVGLPLAIFVKNLMLGNINTTGVNIPTMPEVYELVLEELKQYGVEFIEKEVLIK